MPLIIHRLAAAVAMLCIVVFFSTTILVELFGTPDAVATLKALVVWPGLFILVPSIALAGGSGFSLANHRGGRLVLAKKKRMRVIAANGMVVLVPCALLLRHWAALGAFDTAFYLVQCAELLAGGINLILMGRNARDGFKLSRRSIAPE